MNKIHFTEDQLHEFFDEDIAVKSETYTDYKYTWKSYVVPFEDKMWEFSLRWDRNEGLDFWGGADAYEVEQKEVTKTTLEWVVVE